VTFEPEQIEAAVAAAYPNLERDGNPDVQWARDVAGSLRLMVREAWPLVESSPFKSNWHIDAICDHLEAVSAGEIKKLALNFPPRHGKSLTVSVLWPAWEWLTRPETRWLFASYAQKLSTRDNRKARQIIESKGGRELGGTRFERLGYAGVLQLLGRSWTLEDDQNEKLRYENTAGGYRIGTSVGGSATGDGGDIIAIDDPLDADDAESKSARDAVIDWLDGTMSTRLNDPETGRRVLVMQRLHQQDATGHLLEQGGWTHLCLPAEYEPKHPFVYPDKVKLPSGRELQGDPRTEEGDLLWPDHFGEAAVAELKTTLGSYRSAGQLQQRPAPAEGGMFKRPWWRRSAAGFETYLSLGWDQVIQSWDMRFGESQTKGSSWVVGQVLGFHGADTYVLAQIRGKLSFPETIAAVKAMSAFRPDASAKLVERKANGSAVIATLQRKIPGLIPIDPEGGKDARAAAIAAFVEAGNVWLPDSDFIPCPPAWTDDRDDEVTKTQFKPTSVTDFIEEFAAFPKATNDDQVDALSQGINWKQPQARRSAPAPKVKAKRERLAGDILGAGF
jgi:predicted phage terminase large subunit-like protein